MLRRLLFSYLIIIALTIALLAVGVRLVTAHTFSRYLSEQSNAHNQMFPVMLAAYYTRYGTWDGVQSDLDQATLMIGLPLILADTDGNIVAATPRDAPPSFPPQHWGGQAVAEMGAKMAHQVAIPIKASENRTVGTIYIGDAPPVRERIDEQFLTNMNHALIGAGLLVAIFATGVAVWLAYSISRPLTLMSQAAGQIAQGDYSTRVTLPISSLVPRDMPYFASGGRTTDEMITLARAFNQMAEGIGEVERLRRELVANVSHDLRTPLTVLLGYLEGLRSGQIADRRSAEMAFEAMHSETTHLLHLVDDLRQVADLDSGQLPLERHPIALSDLMSDAIARIAPVAAAKGVRVSQEIPDLERACGQPINLDAERIGQALFNLLENSVRHTPKGGTITLRAHCSLDQLTLIVEDNGEGIPPEHLPHLFERFYRADPVRNRASGGSGLGLSIVQTIVEAHGGQVSAQSDGVGHGSTFSIRLPVE